MQAGGAVRWMAAAVWRRGGWLQGLPLGSVPWLRVVAGQRGIKKIR